MTSVLPGMRLSRAALDDSRSAAAAPPVRIVHLGVGAFARAHQVWYTAHADDAAEWGILGFTGRSAEAAQRLGPQDGLYTLVERGPTGDRFEVVPNLVAVHPADRVDLLAAALRDPAVAIVTLTITESGYRLRPDGAPDLADPSVVADLAALRSTGDPTPTTALGRLLLALDARRRAGGPPLAIVSCDNIPSNGAVLRRALTELAERASAPLSQWLRREVSFVSTSVDRITPRTAERDLQAVAAATGWEDAAPVVTEPFSDWVLCGEFPSGRPAWETAGARFVADIEPYEARKLWMLNGAHTLLATLGGLRGHRTVADAIADPECRAAVERLWDEDERHLPPELDLAAYRRALLDRFGNPRIEHLLAQIAADTATKLRLRVIPVAERELAAGGRAEGCALPVAAWIVSEDGGRPSAAQFRRRLALLSPALSSDAGFRGEVAQAIDRLLLPPSA